MDGGHAVVSINSFHRRHLGMYTYTNQGVFTSFTTIGPWSGMEKGTCDKLDKVAKRSQDRGTFSVYFNYALQHTMLLMLFKVAPIPVPVRHGWLSTYYNQAKSCVVSLNYMGTIFISTLWGYCIYCSFMKKLRHRYA